MSPCLVHVNKIYCFSGLCLEMRTLLRALQAYTRQPRLVHHAVCCLYGDLRPMKHCCLATSARVVKERKYTPRRAVLYVPGNDERKLLKIPMLNVDCAVMDCEDGVALNRKVWFLCLRNVFSKRNYQFLMLI